MSFATWRVFHRSDEKPVDVWKIHAASSCFEKNVYTFNRSNTCGRADNERIGWNVEAFTKLLFRKRGWLVTDTVVDGFAFISRHACFDEIFGARIRFAAVKINPRMQKSDVISRIEPRECVGNSPIAHYLRRLPQAHRCKNACGQRSRRKCMKNIGLIIAKNTKQSRELQLDLLLLLAKMG